MKKQLVVVMNEIREGACTPRVPAATLGYISDEYDPPEGKVAVTFPAAALGYEISDDDETEATLYLFPRDLHYLKD